VAPTTLGGLTGYANGSRALPPADLLSFGSPDPTRPRPRPLIPRNHSTADMQLMTLGLLLVNRSDPAGRWRAGVQHRRGCRSSAATDAQSARAPDGVGHPAAGLAGYRGGLQIARAGVPGRLLEMRRQLRSPAHHSAEFAELRLQQQFWRPSPQTGPPGLLQEGIAPARIHRDRHRRSPCGASRASAGVDLPLSAALTAALERPNPLIPPLERGEQRALPDANEICVSASR